MKQIRAIAKRNDQDQKSKDEIYEYIRTGMIVCIILNSLGFPGRYTELFGNSISTLCEYGCFALQIILMMTSGSRGLMELKLIDLKAKYIPVYLVPVVFGVESMLVSRYPQEQVITCVRFGVTVLFAVWLAETYTAEEILKMIYYALAAFAGATLIFLVIAPGRAFIHEVSDHDFAGILQTKNNAAAELSLGILMQLSLFKILREKQKKISRNFIVLLVLQGILVILCNATGALFCAVLPIIYLFVMDRKNGQIRLPLGVLYITGSVGFIFAALSILPLFDSFFQAIGKDATLTGRVPLWKQIVKVMSEHHTFTGYGYGMFWRDRSAVALIHSAFYRNSFMGSMTTGAHNVILDLWLNVGLLGIGSFFTAVLASMSHIRRMSNENYILCSGYLLWFLLSGLTERAFSPYQYQTLFLFIVLAMGCNKPLPEGRRMRKVGEYDNV